MILLVCDAHVIRSPVGPGSISSTTSAFLITVLDNLGSVKKKVAPLLSPVSTHMQPPWWLIIFLAIARPTPVLGYPLEFPAQEFRAHRISDKKC